MQTHSRHWTETRYKPGSNYQQFLEKTGSKPNHSENFLSLWLSGNTCVGPVHHSGTKVSVFVPFCFPKTTEVLSHLVLWHWSRNQMVHKDQKKQDFGLSSNCHFYKSCCNCNDSLPLAHIQQCEYALSAEGLIFRSQFFWMGGWLHSPELWLTNQQSWPLPAQENLRQTKSPFFWGYHCTGSLWAVVST